MRISYICGTGGFGTLTGRTGYMYMGRASVGESLRRQAGDKLLTGAALACSDNVSCAKGGYASECGNVNFTPWDVF